ncbi:MAG: hypothetical protein PVH61_07765 [Candidatus Aminicenantes bacterium]|jgi:hypothetical protein
MGTKKNGPEGKKMNGNEKKWSGPGKNDLYRELLRLMFIQNPPPVFLTS